MFRMERNGEFRNDKIEGVCETLVEMGGLHAMYYRPEELTENSRTAVLIMHCDQNYIAWRIGPQLAKQGFTVLACESIESGDIDRKFSILNKGMKFLRGISCVKKIVLLGHSGGATLMTAYQSIAENGVQIYQGPEKIYACRVEEQLESADGIILIDANYGNGVMTLLSLDPAIVEEGNGMKLDPEYDIFNPANGYDPAGSHYSEAFIAKYQAAQARRNQRLIKKALERLHAIEQGKGFYVDDEPFFITAGSQIKPNNRLLPQDLHFMRKTQGAYDLIHGDGSVTHEVIYGVRTAEIDRCFSNMYEAGVNKNTVRGFLSSQAIYASEDFRILENDIIGVDWKSSYASPIGNIEDVKVPLLTMGMTGGYEYAAAEMIYNHAKMEDKTIAFVRGATHVFRPNHAAEKVPGEFGDTEGALYNYMGKWLKEKF